jgi:hypothetical protein
LKVAIVIVDVVIHCAVAIIVDVRRTVAIVVDAVVHRAVAIVDNGKMPVHRQRKRCHHDKGNNAITDDGKDACASAATTQSQRGRRLKDRGCVFYFFVFYLLLWGRIIKAKINRGRRVPYYRRSYRVRKGIKKLR